MNLIARFIKQGLAFGIIFSFMTVGTFASDSAFETGDEMKPIQTSVSDSGRKELEDKLSELNLKYAEEKKTEERLSTKHYSERYRRTYTSTGDIGGNVDVDLPFWHPYTKSLFRLVDVMQQIKTVKKSLKELESVE